MSVTGLDGWTGSDFDPGMGTGMDDQDALDPAVGAGTSLWPTGALDPTDIPYDPALPTSRAGGPGGTAFEWQGRLTEDTPIKVTDPHRPPSYITLFSSLIAKSNGAALDWILPHVDPQTGLSDMLIPAQEQEQSDELTAGFNPAQARVPRGRTSGGEWMDTPSGILARAQDSVAPGRPGEYPADQAEWDAAKAHTAGGAEDVRSAEMARVREVGPVSPTADYAALSEPQQCVSAMEGYTGPLLYPDIQAGLRGTKPLQPGTETARIVDKLTGDMSVGRVRTAAPSILYRQVHAKKGKYDPREWKPGDIYHEPGFTSTSTTPGAAQKFRDVFPKRQVWVPIEIYCPPGTTGFVGLDKFDEVVLDPGRSYRVRGTGPEGQIQVEVVG